MLMPGAAEREYRGVIDRNSGVGLLTLGFGGRATCARFLNLMWQGEQVDQYVLRQLMTGDSISLGDAFFIMERLVSEVAEIMRPIPKRLREPSFRREAVNTLLQAHFAVVIADRFSRQLQCSPIRCCNWVEALVCKRHGSVYECLLNWIGAMLRCGWLDGCWKYPHQNVSVRLVGKRARSLGRRRAMSSIGVSIRKNVRADGPITNIADVEAVPDRIGLTGPNLSDETEPCAPRHAVRAIENESQSHADTPNEH